MPATPDSGFMQRLKGLDPKLGCEFNRETEHFFITYERAVGPPVPVMTVKNAVDGGFRQPDNREIIALQKGDLAREGLDSRLARTAQYMEQVRETTRRNSRQNIRDLTKDDKIQLMRASALATGGSSKANRPFRSITPKVKGKVFK